MRPDEAARVVELQQLVQSTAALLDAEQLADWVDLFDAAGSYQVSSFSTELRKPVIWWQQQAPELRKTLSDVPRHVRDPAQRLHVLGPPLIRLDGDAAQADTAFSLYRTLPTGETSLYLVGRYKDELCRTESGVWKYRLHRVEVATRVLEMFTHLPV
ncbi:MAG TPA: nuclear transport factor 2 family protein [Burkholderiaceae bacterium]|jgi:3-phenylpropionate/cinnamic acid dioxygenase small subunit|nr:nuclear transport factor 2 family protein [Burkholderiaceae bacterium]